MSSVLWLPRDRSRWPTASATRSVVNGAAGKMLRTLARTKPEEMAGALVAIGIPGLIREQVSRKWTLNDVLVDRYKLGRGRAIAGQSRGRGLENEVEAILRGVPVPFDTRVTFAGPAGVTAKCDF